MRPLSVVLADPTHRLPWPGSKGRFFSADGEVVDADDPFWIGLLADKSIVPKSAAEAASAPPTPASAPTLPPVGKIG